MMNCRNVGAMLGCRFDVSSFDLRRSRVDVSTFEVDVSTFEDRCVDLRRLMVVVSTFEDR